MGGVFLTGVSASSAGSDAAGAALGVVMCFMLAVGLLGPLVARVFASLFSLPLRGAGAAALLAATNSRTSCRWTRSMFEFPIMYRHCLNRDSRVAACKRRPPPGG